MGNFFKAILVVALLSASMAHADATEKCQLAKLKAQGKLSLCLGKNAVGVVGGETDASAECQSKFAAALTAADTKASNAGTSCRYVDNGDGTVSDLNTGLMWERKTAAGIHNVNTTYTWSASGTGPNGTAFTGFLGTLNATTSSDGSDTVAACFAGHCDWRLPTVQELRGLVDLSAPGCPGSPCIDPAVGSTSSTLYWSATPNAPGSVAAWYVHFAGGYSAPFSKTSSYYARAVRGGL